MFYSGCLLTYRRHRYLTRWPRRLIFAVTILLLLAVSWRAYQAWQRAYPPTREPLGRLT